MQTCVVCGWDTRSDTRVCLACRQSAEQQSSSTDDRSESEQLLSAVLRSTGGDRPATDDDRTSVDAAVRSQSAPSASDRHRAPDRTGAPDEQIMLRELDPAQQAAGTIETTPPMRESSVAASLLQAFSDRADPTPSTGATASSITGATVPDDDTAQASAVTDEAPVLDTPGDGEPGPMGSEAETARGARQRGDAARDAADADRTADHGEPAVAHPDPAEPRATDDQPTDPDHQPSDEAEPPGAVDPDAMAVSQPADASAGTGDAESPTSVSHDAPVPPSTAEVPETSEEPLTSETSEAPAHTEMSDAPDEPGAPETSDAPETSEDSDAAHASEPSDASDDGGNSATVAPSPPEAESPATGSNTENAPGGQPSSTAPDDDAQSPADGVRGDSGTVRESLRSRLRTIFREMGAWTAVAQFALLITGLVCVFQVVVLLVVLRFLLQSSTQDATTAANMLVAHGRAINGMLPALVAGALIVAVIAIWHARRARDRVPHGTRLFHVPISLWAMIAAASAVAAIVLVDTSSTVEQAAQTTLYAITACAVLGATAFIAPRSIAVATPTASESAAVRDHAGTSADGLASPRAKPAPRAGKPTTPRGESEPPADANAPAERQTTSPDDESRATDKITAPNTHAAQPRSEARSMPDRDELADASEASAA